MRQIMIINMGDIMLSVLKQKKSLGFHEVHDNDLNVCSGMILERVYKHEVHNYYVLIAES